MAVLAALAATGTISAGSARAGDADPVPGIEPGIAELGHGGYIGQQRRTVVAAHAKGDQLAGLNVRCGSSWASWKK